MPVLWSDPTQGQGILPAQAPFFSPGTVDPRLIQAIAQQQQAHSLGAAGQQVTSALGAILADRQRDRIANTLLAAQQQGRVPTSQELTGASTPGLFGGPDVPDLGGTDTYNAYNQALDAAAKRQAQTIHNQYLSSEIYKNVGAGEPRVDIVGPDNTLLSGSQGVPFSQASTYLGHVSRAAPVITKEQQAQVDKQLREQTGYGYDTWKNIAVNTPYSEANPRTGRYLDVSDPKNPKQISTEEAATNPNAVVEIPTGTKSAQGKTSVQTAQIPIPQFAQGKQILSDFMGQGVPGGITIRPHGGGPAIGGGGGGGPATNTAALAQANQIKSDFKAGKITVDEARTKLNALGIFQ